jgi:hypothetical protein
MSTHFPRCPIGKRFCQFFPHRYHFIHAPASSDRPQWSTESRYPIEHRNLWNRFQDPHTLLGVSFGSTTHYALLDVDCNSPYHPQHNESAFKSLLGAYEDIGLNDPIIIQSSPSEGLHIYFVFPKALPTFQIAQLLKLTAITAGFPVKDGTLEIFPNAKRYNPKHPTPYKAHRLPLQLGSYLLDPDYVPYSNQIATFLDRAEQAAAATEIRLLETALAASNARKVFRQMRGDGEKAAAFAADLKEQIEEGWSDFGQTNDLLRVIGTYGRVFEALSGQELCNYIARTAQSLPGYREFCRHQHHIQQRAKEWARCIEKFYYPYGEPPNRTGSFAQMQAKPSPHPNYQNETRQQQAIDRITKGVEWVRQQLGSLPKRVGTMKDALTNAIAALFGTRPSDKTLYRHRELWHPAFIVESETDPTSEESEVDSPKPESQPSDSAPPKNAHQEKSSVCHTPSHSKTLTVGNLESLNSLSEGDCEKSATPPLYMKVKEWICNGTVLLYQGVSLFNTVKLEGKRIPQLRSICRGQRVVLTDEIHSSFLLYPDAIDSLKVYAFPLEVDDSDLPWCGGIPVLAKYLVPLTDPVAEFKI